MYKPDSANQMDMEEESGVTQEANQGKDEPRAAVLEMNEVIEIADEGEEDVIVVK